MSDIPSLWTCLNCHDPRAEIAFLTGALGFVERAVYTEGDAVVHAELVRAGPRGNTGGVMLGPVAADCDRTPGAAAVHLVDDDPDARFAEARAAGAAVVREPWEQHGSRLFEVRDPEGNLWSVGTWHE